MISKSSPKNNGGRKISYLTKEQILLIHSMIIDEIGGGHGVRDHHILLSLEHLPGQTFSGEELYPTIFLKAALYTRNIIQNHPFLDGNKRTGMTSAAIFLEKNGYAFLAHKGEIEKFALRIATEKLELEEIAAWLKHNAKLSSS